jgi:hypothetical protein
MEPSEMEIRVMSLALRNACANADIFAAQSFAPLLDVYDTMEMLVIKQKADGAASCAT